MLNKVKRALWGELSGEDLARFGMLALIFACIIGTYWLMRPLKDSLFSKMVGPMWQPYAKVGVCFLLVPLVLLYSKLVDLFEKQKLFYIIAGFYGALFVVIFLCLLHPKIGIANTIRDHYRWLGWLIYFSVETFGSLMIPLFWSFVVSFTDTTTAKRGYPLITAGGQLGAIFGPICATQAEYLGIPFLMLIVIVGITFIPFFVRFFIKKYPSSAETAVDNQKKAQSGVVEGVRLLFSHPYLLAIFSIVTFLAIVDSIMEYQMFFLADHTFIAPEALTRFNGFFGIAVNGFSFLFVLIGTSFFLRRFGLTFCLVAFPITIIAVVTGVFTVRSLAASFVAMVVFRVLSYSLHNPCKDIMYIPTSKDVKFKVKGWIDMFGHRNAKAAGSTINMLFTTAADLIFFGSIISLGVLGVWVFVALYLGRANQKLTASNKLVS